MLCSYYYYYKTVRDFDYLFVSVRSKLMNSHFIYSTLNCHTKICWYLSRNQLTNSWIPAKSNKEIKELQLVMTAMKISTAKTKTKPKKNNSFWERKWKFPDNDCNDVRHTKNYCSFPQSHNFPRFNFLFLSSFCFFFSFLLLPFFFFSFLFSYRRLNRENMRPKAKSKSNLMTSTKKGRFYFSLMFILLENKMKINQKEKTKKSKNKESGKYCDKRQQQSTEQIKIKNKWSKKALQFHKRIHQLNTNKGIYMYSRRNKNNKRAWVWEKQTARKKERIKKQKKKIIINNDQAKGGKNNH